MSRLDPARPASGGDGAAPAPPRAPGASSHLVVMGVAGCGKSAVGARIATRLGLPLVEGDDFHPAGNVDKMRRGIPLTDTDRADWLRRLAGEVAARPGGAVLTCSALKAAYRDALRQGVAGLRFLHLAISPEEALRRVAQRPGHFYPPSLVASQFEALQDPSAEAGVLVLPATLDVQALCEQAVEWMASPGG